MENIFDGIAAPPAPGLFLFVEENAYGPPRRILHPRVQVEDSADDTSDEEPFDEQHNVENVAAVNDEVDDEENWEVLDEYDDDNGMFFFLNFLLPFYYNFFNLNCFISH